MESNGTVASEIEILPSKLPSRGLAYPLDAKISYLTYTFGEVKSASISNLNILSALERTLKGVKASFDVKKLTLLDALYIGVLRKTSSMGELRMSMPYACTECGKVSKAHFTHIDIDFQDIVEDVTALPIVAKLGGKECEFWPMTVGDYLDLNNGTFEKIINGKVNKTSMYAIMVKNMTFEESYKHIYNLKDVNDMMLLEDIDKALLHDIKPLKAKCTNIVKVKDVEKECGTENLVKIEGREALIMPFREGERTIRDRVRFGPTPKSEPLSN